MADEVKFSYEPHANFPPITLDVARNLLNHDELIVPTQWWEEVAFLDEAADRGERWNTKVRFGGATANLGEGPQAHIDTVYFISDGEFSRETLKNMVQTADMDAIEATIEDIDGAETLRLYWDE